MVQISRVFALFSAISVGLAASVKRTDLNAVEQDVTKIASAVKTLGSDIGGFSSTPSLATALTIKNGCDGLSAALIIGTTDANSCSPFGDAGTVIILDDVERFVPTIEAALKQLIEEFLQFKGLPAQVVPAVCQGLRDLKAKTQAFSVAVLGKCSANQVGRATTLENRILSALNGAISRYCL